MIGSHYPQNRTVALLVYEGLCTFEFGCAAEVFGLPRPELGPRWYRFETCATTLKPMRGQYGLRVVADGGLDRLVRAGTIVIPGWRGIDIPADPPLLDALRKAHAKGARLLSICSGAFVLAATGLLDGNRIATHWRYAEKLRSMFPQIECDPNVLYVDQNRIVTSAGSAAGLDACLHVVRCDYGAVVANHVAKRLVLAPQRDGGQAQFIERPSQNRQGHRLSTVIDALRQRSAEALSVPDLARMAAMSERTFLRRFKEATGTTPAHWITLNRIDHARELLETSSQSIDAIAERCGFGTSSTLRHHFRQKIGITPAAYRQRFASAGAITIPEESDAASRRRHKDDPGQH